MVTREFFGCNEHDWCGYAFAPQSLNRYSYAGNNPVNRVDPSGHADTMPCASGGCSGATFTFVGTDGNEIDPQLWLGNPGSQTAPDFVVFSADVIKVTFGSQRVGGVSFGFGGAIVADRYGNVYFGGIAGTGMPGTGGLVSGEKSWPPSGSAMIGYIVQLPHQIGPLSDTAIASFITGWSGAVTTGSLGGWGIAYSPGGEPFKTAFLMGVTSPVYPASGSAGYTFNKVGCLPNAVAC